MNSKQDSRYWEEYLAWEEYDQGTFQQILFMSYTKEVTQVMEESEPM